MTDKSEQTKVFEIHVPGVGTFECQRRNMRDELRIEAEYSRLTEGIETPTDALETSARMISAIKVLVTSAPEGWDIDEMDPFDQDTYAKIVKVYLAIREKENSFRRLLGNRGQASGTSPSGESGAVVSENIQPTAERSPVP